MTSTETKFRKHFKKVHPFAYLKKIPDFKIMGNLAVVGLPDYLSIEEGRTIWYEVKSVKGNILALRHFTDGQLQEFPKMIEAGAIIFVYVFTKSKGCKTVRFEKIMEQKTIKFS